MKITKHGAGLKIHIGKGKTKRTVKFPIAEAIIIAVGLVEGYALGGITGALLGVALGGLAIISCILCIFPFIGLLFYHWIMTYAIGIAQVSMKNLYLVGFIYAIYVTWEVLSVIFKALEKKSKEVQKAKKQM